MVATGLSFAAQVGKGDRGVEGASGADGASDRELRRAEGETKASVSSPSTLNSTQRGSSQRLWPNSALPRADR